MFTEALTNATPSPLITYYDQTSRIELSGVTFANWVMKTANLIDDLDADITDPVALGLAKTHPGHWVSLIWTAAVWYVGGSVAPDVPPHAAFAVVGPEDARRGASTVACSLHPLGQGFDEPPAGCIDYADVLAQPDQALPGEANPDTKAWGEVSYRMLDEVPGRADRRLYTDPQCSWEFLAEALVAPLAGGGSSVITVGLDADRVQRIAVSENVSVQEA